MSRVKVILLSIACAGGVAAMGSASADPAWEFTSAGNSYTNNSWDFATAFSVTTDISATGLGYYADPSNGQVNSNGVALYLCANATCTTTGTLIASATVTNIYPLDGHFRYVTITPVNLTAGDSYEVAGASSGDNYTWNDPGFKANSNISLIPLDGQIGRWQTEATGGSTAFLNFGQTDRTGQDGYWGPNVFFGKQTFIPTVPEPSTLALLGLGFMGLGFARRQRAG